MSFFGSSTPPASTSSTSISGLGSGTRRGKARDTLRQQKRAAKGSRDTCKAALVAVRDKCNEAMTKTDEYVIEDDKAEQEDASDTLRNADANVEADDVSGPVAMMATRGTVGGYRRKTRGRKGKKSRASRRR